jgi:hypothetical protein
MIMKSSNYNYICSYIWIYLRYNILNLLFNSKDFTTYHLSRFYHPNDGWFSQQIMELLALLFFPVSVTSSLLGPREVTLFFSSFLKKKNSLIQKTYVPSDKLHVTSYVCLGKGWMLARHTIAYHQKNPVTEVGNCHKILCSYRSKCVPQFTPSPVGV